jgi:hypothetical protein
MLRHPDVQWKQLCCNGFNARSQVSQIDCQPGRSRESRKCVGGLQGQQFTARGANASFLHLRSALAVLANSAAPNDDVTAGHSYGKCANWLA